MFEGKAIKWSLAADNKVTLKLLQETLTFEELVHLRREISDLIIQLDRRKDTNAPR